MNWKTLFEKYDEYRQMSEEELVKEMGEHWAWIFLGLKDNETEWLNKKPTEDSHCGDDYCEIRR